jgi:cobalt-precorrin-7 (C5)-methyltransferase
LKKYFSNEELEVIPGISSYQYMFSRIGECWQNFILASAHGRDFDYVKAMDEKDGVVLLTDEKNTPYTIGKNVYESGIRGVEIIVGERLSYPDEMVTRVNIEKFEELNREFKMNIVILKKGENYAHL